MRASHTPVLLLLLLKLHLLQLQLVLGLMRRLRVRSHVQCGLRAAPEGKRTSWPIGVEHGRRRIRGTGAATGAAGNAGTTAGGATGRVRWLVARLVGSLLVALECEKRLFWSCVNILVKNFELDFRGLSRTTLGDHERLAGLQEAPIETDNSPLAHQ